MAHVGKRPDIIDSKAVRGLVETHAIQRVVVIGQLGGFAILVKYGAGERAISTQRSPRVRLWRNLNAAAAFVRDALGVPRFEVNMVGHRRSRASAPIRHSGSFGCASRPS